jgi:hypothetical protein
VVAVEVKVVPRSRAALAEERRNSGRKTPGWSPPATPTDRQTLVFLFHQYSPIQTTMDTNEHPNTQPTRLKLLQWHKLFDSDSPPRIGIEVRQRLPTTTIGSFSAGMAIGSAHGTKMAAYRFRAENAHRFPTSSKGWYQYHRNKNYAVIVGGVREGVKLGLKVGAAAMAFCLFEETADHVRNDRRDFLSTVTAGLSLSGIYSMLGMVVSAWLGRMDDADWDGFSAP